MDGFELSASLPCRFASRTRWVGSRVLWRRENRSVLFWKFFLLFSLEVFLIILSYLQKETLNIEMHKTIFSRCFILA
jgi:hypothetical protein